MSGPKYKLKLREAILTHEPLVLYAVAGLSFLAFGLICLGLLHTDILIVPAPLVTWVYRIWLLLVVLAAVVQLFRFLALDRDPAHEPVTTLARAVGFFLPAGLISAPILALYALHGHVMELSAMEIAVEPDEIRWCGSVPRGAVDRIKHALENADGTRAHPPRRLVMMNNTGGKTTQILELVNRYQELGITEITASGLCLSACAMMWAALPVASIEAESTLGFHGSYKALSKRPSNSLNDLNIPQAILANDRGFTQATLDRWLGYSPYELGFVGPGDLAALGIAHTVRPRRLSAGGSCARADLDTEETS